ncbi:hypothetical protein [Asticcacaulis sp. W401b]|uniref:hypothetical protein n=1 Tax=Asticcacaulis sp. W401b TaxID=3388666 RepID=UPI0039707979
MVYFSGNLISWIAQSRGYAFRIGLDVFDESMDPDVVHHVAMQLAGSLETLTKTAVGKLHRSPEAPMAYVKAFSDYTDGYTLCPVRHRQWRLLRRRSAKLDRRLARWWADG